MPIGILNNIAGLQSENQLAITNNALQNVLLQLSSGSRINSGADDTAGLAIANSNFITANVGALTSGGLLGGQAGATLAANGAVTSGDNITIGGTTYTFESAAALAAAPTGATQAAVKVAIDGNANPVTAMQNTLANLAAAVNGGSGAGTLYQSDATLSGPNSNPDATASASGNTITFSATAAGQALGGANISSTIGTGAEFAFLQTGGTHFTTGTTSDLLTATDAQAALASINTAIASVAGTRGQIGAVVNRLQSASNVISNQVTNLTSAENTITAADIPTAVANLTKYPVLEQTGISALARERLQNKTRISLKPPLRTPNCRKMKSKRSAIAGLAAKSSSGM